MHTLHGCGALKAIYDVLQKTCQENFEESVADPNARSDGQGRRADESVDLWSWDGIEAWAAVVGEKDCLDRRGRKVSVACRSGYAGRPSSRRHSALRLRSRMTGEAKPLI